MSCVFVLILSSNLRVRDELCFYRIDTHRLGFGYFVYYLYVNEERQMYRRTAEDACAFVLEQLHENPRAVTNAARCPSLGALEMNCQRS